VTTTLARRRYLGWTLLSAVIVIGATWHFPEQLYNDPAWLMKCLQQYQQGLSPSLNNLVSPNPQDLSKDVVEWGTWWPPGPTLLAYPLVAGGLPLGDAIRVLVDLCILIGSVGWVLWFSQFDLPDWIQVVLALFIPWMRYPSNALFYFSAEIFVFATAPWALWLTYRLVEVWSERKKASPGLIVCAALIGLGLGLRYVLKYSAVFGSVGALLFLGLRSFQRDDEHKTNLATGFWTMALFTAIPILGLNILNRLLGSSMNNLGSVHGLDLGFWNICCAVSNAALGLADADSLLRFIFLHPSHGLFRNVWAICLVGLPGGILVLVLLAARRPFKGPALLAIATFLTGLVSVFAIWTLSKVLSNDDGHNARYIIATDLAVLPLVLESGCRFWAKSGRIRRMILAMMGILYIGIPFVYGVISVGAKIRRMPQHYRLSPTHLYNPLLAREDLASVRARLLLDFNPATDVWYSPDISTPLELPGRVIIRDPDFMNEALLRSDRFETSAPLRIQMLLPSKFEINGKGLIIRQSFPQAGAWTRSEIPGSDYVLWRTWLR
jgi:hypothetical protein